MRCREGLIVISSTPKNLPEARVSKAIDTDKFVAARQLRWCSGSPVSRNGNARSCWRHGRSPSSSATPGTRQDRAVDPDLVKRR